ncbi:MAG: tetratricopeptide repeat protein, partial [Planctomycetaceae bacterium]
CRWCPDLSGVARQTPDSSGLAVCSNGRAAESGGVTQCRAALAAQPGDPRLILNLADALGAAQQFEEALELCLGVVRETGGDDREHARSTMVKLFHLLGTEAELTRVYRRKLASALY